MSRPRIAVIAIAGILPVILAMGIVGTATQRIYVTDANGKVRHDRTTTSPTEGESYTEGILLSNCADGICDYDTCGFCHTGGEDNAREVFTTANHLKDYYPRFKLSLSEGQKLSWGQSGGYLTSQRAKLEYHLRDGTLDMIAPPGSLILKDRSGRPYLLSMPGEPTLQPRTR